MSINPDHQPGIRQPLTDSEGNALPPLEVRSPAPNFGDDAQGERLREANRLAEQTRKRRRKKTVAGIVAGTVLIGGGTAVAMLTGGSPERAETTSSAPGETGKSEEKPVEFGLSATEYAKDPEALAQAFYAQMDSLFIAGINETTAHADERYEMSDNEYIDMISSEVDEQFIDNLFVEGWQNNPDLATYVATVIETAHDTRWGRLKTYSGGTDDKEPYVRRIVVDEASGTTHPLTTVVRWHGYDNRDMNTAEDGMTGLDPNTETGSETLTWKNVDGQLKISDFDR